MGRPANPVGTSGSVRTYQLPDGTWQARTLVRDPDGVTRHVKRKGKTEAAARRVLAQAVRDRVHSMAGADITPETRVKAAAEAWLKDPATQKLAPRTLEQYERQIRVHIAKGVGALRCRELTVAVASAFLSAVEKDRGAPTARLCRSVLSGTCAWAAQRGAMDFNSVRDSGRISAKPKRQPRAMSMDQVRDLIMWADYDQRSRSRDLPDFVRWMVATGLRIGEAAAVRPMDVDLDAGTVAVTGNLARVRGRGIIRQEDESNKLHPRTLSLPVWAVRMLKARLHAQPVAADAPLFPAPLGGWRDPSNTQADLRDLREFAGYGWVTSHTFRKTVATIMDEAGLSARDGADQLGHANPAMTQNRYWGRRRVVTAGAAVLEAIEPQG